MKVRSQIELNQRLSESSGWRRQEMLNIQALSGTAREHAGTSLRRAAMLMLYAHWEGFTKEGFQYYWAYVCSQRITVESASSAVLAAYMRSSVQASLESRFPIGLAQSVEFLRSNLGSRVRLPGVDIVDTRSNLNYSVFESISMLLGVSVPPYISMRAMFIDEKIVAPRNEIAHGKGLVISAEDVDERVEFVMQSIQEVTDAVENAAALKRYLKA